MSKIATVILTCLLAVGLLSIGTGAAQAADSGYNPQIRHSFVSNCISSGGYRSACTCIYRTLVREVPFWKFVQVDRRAAQGRPLPRSWHRIIDRCD